VFTFGRDHEKRCARQYVRAPDQCVLADEVVDAVHDLLESKKPYEEVARLLKRALSEGGSGVWEQAGGWILKLAREYSAFDAIWAELAAHKSATVRFRVASFLSDMKPDMFAQLAPILLADSSAKVRARASP